MLKRDSKITCSKYANYSKLNSKHDWGGPIWPLNENENLHIDND